MTPELQARLDTALAAHGYQRSQALAGVDAGYQRGAQHMAAVCLPPQPDAVAHLRAFEDGLQRLQAARQQDAQLELVLAPDVDGALQRAAASYRAALNKYRNAVIFEDLGIGLCLLSRLRPAQYLPPSEVNRFLRGLNAWLLAG